VKIREGPEKLTPGWSTNMYLYYYRYHFISNQPRLLSSCKS